MHQNMGSTWFLLFLGPSTWQAHQVAGPPVHASMRPQPTFGELGFKLSFRDNQQTRDFSVLSVFRVIALTTVYRHARESEFFHQSRLPVHSNQSVLAIRGYHQYQPPRATDHIAPVFLLRCHISDILDAYKVPPAVEDANLNEFEKDC